MLQTRFRGHHLFVVGFWYHFAIALMCVGSYSLCHCCKSRTGQISRLDAHLSMDGDRVLTHPYTMMVAPMLKYF
eukprot:284815154_5